MASDRKGFSNSIGGAGGASEIGSKSIIEGDGKFDETRAQPDNGAGSIIGRIATFPSHRRIRA